MLIMFIRKEESEKHEIGSGTKLLFTFLSWRFFDMRRERHNFFLCWLFHLTPLRAAPRCKLLVWSRRAPKNQLPSSNVESQLFFQIPKSSTYRFRAWRHSRHQSYFLYCDICVCHIRPARAWTPALNVCT